MHGAHSNAKPRPVRYGSELVLIRGQAMKNTEFNRETDRKVTGAVRNISLQELI